ncbi:MAG: single-stranded-DNA-specific exonuclease [Clostridia bacterium]|nr:single-stranded-DNA-specific exonuclease [Clostridia bacterium]
MPVSWEIFKPQPDLRDLFSRELGILPLTAQVLLNRGLSSLEEARVFLTGGPEHLKPPASLPGLEAAVERLALAVRRREKVLIYGDYDVDGLTAAAIVGETLRRAGIQAGYCLPQRLQDGYGLHLHLLEKALAEGYRLVVTVDCGITAVTEASWAIEQGLDLIITDHHLPGPILPPALAVVNPVLAGLPVNLAGAGVAFKLAQGLSERLGLPPHNGVAAGWALDLVVLGTIADSVPLLGENRLLVRLGLPVIRQASRAGIKALLEVAGLDAAGIDAEKIAYVLAPRLNAAGRLGSARPALELLTTSSEQRAWELAQSLEQENRTRQLVQDGIFKEAVERIEDEELYRRPAIVLASPDWHPGVLGIVAARLAERYYRPVILLSSLDGVTARGSGRSIPEVDLYAALSRCKEHILAFGGHSLAAGLEVNTGELDELRSCFEVAVERQLEGREIRPSLRADAEVLLSQLTPELALELERLEPFGEGNPRPLFVYRGARVKSWRQVGQKGDHLKLYLAAEGLKLPAIGFHMPKSEDLKDGSLVDLAFRPVLDGYNGGSQLELILEEVRPAFLAEAAATREEEPPPAGFFLDEIRCLSRQGTVLAAFLSTRVACHLEAVLRRWGIKARAVDLGPEFEENLFSYQVLLAPVEFLRENKIYLERFCYVLAPPAAAQEIALFAPGVGGKNIFCCRTAKSEICLLSTQAETWDRLQGMLASGRRVLIYTMTVGEAHRILKRLGLKPGAHNSLLLETPVTAGQALIIRERAEKEGLKFLLSPRHLPAGFFPAEEVFFTFCPGSWEEVWSLLPAGWAGKKIYIISANIIPLKPPDLRGELAKLYRRLRYFAGRRNPMRLTLHNNHNLMLAGLGIFAELNLIEARRTGRALEIELLNLPASKLCLKTSWRYRQLEKEAGETLAFRAEAFCSSRKGCR